MAVLVDTVFDLRTLSVAVGTVVDLKGYLSELNGGDGGGGSFIAVNKDGTTGIAPIGEPLMPDFGLLFPTADSEILLLRQGVNWRAAPFSELAPHAFPANTPDGDRLTIMSSSPTQASWWGAVPTVPKRSPCADGSLSTSLGSGNIENAADLYCAVIGVETTDKDVLFEVYPFLKEGAFLQRNERDDFRNRPAQTVNSPECGGDRPMSTGPFRDGTPNILFMPFHFVALQAAIDRTEHMTGAPGDGLTISGGVYRTNRHLTIRKPRTVRFPAADAPDPAVFEFGIAGYPQNAVLMLLPSWEAMTGDAEKLYDGGDFADEHVYGEPVPAVRFEIADVVEPFDGYPDSVLFPLDNPTPALQAGRELFFRLGRTDHDSAEPFTFEWRTIGSVTVLPDLAGTRVALQGAVLPRPTVMQMTIASIYEENDPGTVPPGFCDGDDFEDGVLQVTLAEGLSKSLKAHNPQFFDVPFWRTEHTWTGGSNGGAVTTQLLRRKVCGPNGTPTENSPFYFLGDDVLRLCVVGAAQGAALSEGATAEWGRESWAFLPLTDPDGSQILGRIHARTAVASRDNGGAVQAYNCRDVFIEDVVAEALPEDPNTTVDNFSRFDRAVILTTTVDAVVGSAEVRTTRRNPTDDDTPRRALAVDLQQTRGSAIGTTRMVASHGGGVQFEEGENDAVGTNLPPGVPALDVALVPLDPDDSALGTAVETTYTSDDCHIGPVVVRAASGVLPGNPNDPFGRTRYGLIGVAGSPTANDQTVELIVDAMDVREELLVVQPFYLPGLATGGVPSDGANRFLYQTGPAASPTVKFQSQRLEAPSGTRTLTGSTVEVVPVSGVPRRISADLILPFDKRGTGAAVLWHRQGGSALVGGDLRPEQGPDAQAALEVYTGLVWKEYGYFVAVPGPEGWPAGASLDWGAEVFVDDAHSPTPPALVTASFDATFNPQSSESLTLPVSGDGQFLVGFQVAFVDLNPPPGIDAVFQTGGKMTLNVTAKYTGASRTVITVVSGENAEVPDGAVFVDLGSTPAALVPARGARQFFAPGAALPRLELNISTEAAGGFPFSLSGTGPHRLRVLAILSK